MEDAATITVAQLRAALKSWEVDVRANRGAFASEEECRAAPLDEQVDDSVSAILRYAQEAQVPVQVNRPVPATALPADTVNAWQERNTADS